MAFGPPGEGQLVGYEGSDEWYKGVPTAAGGALAGGVGAGISLLTGPAAPVVGPILSGIFGALGSSIGSIFEPKPTPVYAEASLPAPPPIPTNTFTKELASGALLDPSWTQLSPPLSNVYGVQNPYGFG